MTAAEWAKIQFFKPSEFDSPDITGSGAMGMDLRLLEKLDKVRRAWAKPITITSGFRTVAHNAAVGGKPNSAHLRGLAADLQMSGLADCIRMVFFAAAQGIRRVGVDQKGRFVHLDVDPSLPTPALWWYNEGSLE